MLKIFLARKLETIALRHTFYHAVMQSEKSILVKMAQEPIVAVERKHNAMRLIIKQ